MTTPFWLWGGLALTESFHWTLYVFGTFLLVTGVSGQAQGRHLA